MHVLYSTWLVPYRSTDVHLELKMKLDGVQNKVLWVFFSFLFMRQEETWMTQFGGCIHPDVSTNQFPWTDNFIIKGGFPCQQWVSRLGLIGICQDKSFNPVGQGQKKNASCKNKKIMGGGGGVGQGRAKGISVWGDVQLSMTPVSCCTCGLYVKILNKRWTGEITMRTINNYVFLQKCNKKYI